MAEGGWDREDEVATAELTGYPNKPQIDDGDWCAGVRVLRAGPAQLRRGAYRTDRMCNACNAGSPGQEVEVKTCRRERMRE